MTTRLDGFTRFLRSFARARHGGVAMMFALSLPVLAMAALVGVDVHRISTVRANLQDALDAAALAAARSSHMDDEGLTTVGMAALRANLQAYPEITLREDLTTFRLTEGGAVVADSSVDVATLVANIVLPPYGQVLDDQVQVGVESEVLRSNYRIELALVIDNTGSMAQSGKLRAAQDAATNLVERLAAAAERSTSDDAVRIALIPFSQTVRVGAQYQQANWMDRSANATGNDYIFDGGANRIAMFNRMGIDWAGCVESRPYPYDTLDTAPTASDRASLFVHYFAPDEPDVGDYSDWNYQTDNNYIDDRLDAGGQWVRRYGQWQYVDNGNKDWFKRLRNSDKYRSSGLSLYGGRGPNRGCDLEPLTRLTTDYGSITDSIDDMVANGNTNIPMGLMWGWHALSPRAPFSDGRPYGEDRLQKIAILMTDGDNVNDWIRSPLGSRYSGVGYIGQKTLGVDESSSGRDRRDAMDARLEELCANMQDSDIILYTVGVGVDSRTQDLLRACATTPENFFNVSGASGIGDAFDRIAGSIESLRIAR